MTTNSARGPANVPTGRAEVVAAILEDELTDAEIRQAARAEVGRILNPG